MKKVKFGFARRMRDNPTPAEAALWPLLKERDGVRPAWRRQEVILGWIVDFYCAKKRIAVELDGSAHDDRSTYDANRTEMLLKKARVRVIRFTNAEVLADPRGVADKLLEMVAPKL